jgi:tetratricopeptide (TPR) repeat protein
MKILPLFFLSFTGFVFAQDFDKEKYLKEISENACECIDSIAVTDRPKQEVIEKMGDCIDDQVTAYQLGLKLSDVNSLFAMLGDAEDKTVNIELSTHKNSSDYKQYYYEIERYLMANCEPMNEKVNSNEKRSDKSVSSNPEALRYYELGYLEAKEGNYERSNEYYREALRIDPNFAFAWDNIGINNRRMEKYAEAIEAYENSLKLDPYGMMPLQNIAIVYVYTKEFDKAIAAYEKLGKVHPGNPEVYYGLAHIYTDHLKQYEEALEYICKAYVAYVEMRSPYRVDAEHMINIIRIQMEKQKKLDTFYSILKKYNLNYED